ncbi:nicotinamide mononucleotide transporter [Niastella caeni]|uniref:Nicotinamide riboside transporter PnuC n=2 Tax=Niastella caeni TaxID=2569763 RepID=A0A4V4H1V7_9BACT|nr:nicotinamide mononucleotide transporter [Niastella caeni]
MHFFDIKNIAFTALGLPVSYLELVTFLFGLLSTYLASRNNILNWPTGIINAVLYFIVCIQIRLYIELFMQVYILIVSGYGWRNWKTTRGENIITTISIRNRIILAASIIIGTIAFGFFAENLYLLLPSIFVGPAPDAFINSFIMMVSIAAFLLLAKRKLECWILWITGSVVGAALTFKNHYYFLSIEYIIFLGLALYALYYWNRQMKNEQDQ